MSDEFDVEPWDQSKGPKRRPGPNDPELERIPDQPPGATVPAPTEDGLTDPRDPISPEELTVQAGRVGGSERITFLEGKPSLSEAEEQEIRDFYGYSQTEKRTKAERDAAAKRMLKSVRVKGP